MNATTLPDILIVLLSLACITVVLVYLHKALRMTKWSRPVQNRIFSTTVLLIAGWMMMVGIMAIKGFFADLTTLPPRPIILILLPLPLVLVTAFSKRFKEMALTIPEHWLIRFQAFRIFVELILWQAFAKNILPVQMTFEGRNWDIASGVLALVVAWMVLHKRNNYRTIATAYNIIGIGLLLNVLIVAFLSMPTPLRYFMNEPTVEKVGQFPMIYLPSVLVVLAYSFHIFSLRQLWLLKQVKQTGKEKEKVPAYAQA